MNDYVDCGNDSSLNEDFSGLTLAAWVYPQNLSGLQAIIAKWAWSVEQEHFGLFTAGNYVRICVADSKTPENALPDDTTPLSNNNWYHVAGSWSNDRVYKMYVNGINVKNTTQDGNGINTNSSITLKIGRQVVGRNRPFNGLIDEARIYDRALSAEEI